ncbi:YihY/virulence factor BrkB family protein [Methylobacterium oxalidis]|uniref:YihY/virulence factor BrkB family protein n=1 Tax=Methylobacterium oxalidis TaxID=944322 RepID=UPI0033163633
MSEAVCNADEPSAISSSGWGSILRRLSRSLKRDDIWLRAAGVAFYTVLAAIPALVVPVSLHGLIADPAAVRDSIKMLGGLLPVETSQFLADQMQGVAASSKVNLGAGLGGATLAALWSGRSGASAIIAAINMAYGEREQRSFMRRERVALTVGLITLLFVSLAFVLIALLPLAVAALPVTPEQSTLIMLGRWPALAVLMMVGLSLLYRFAPCRRRAKWRWVSAGSVVASVLWLSGSAAFSFYVERIASYNQTFGTLGAVMLLLTWLFLSAFSVLLGAELNAELERQTTSDTTEGVDRPQGRRGAAVADTTA